MKHAPILDRSRPNLLLRSMLLYWTGPGPIYKLRKGPILQTYKESGLPHTVLNSSTNGGFQYEEKMSKWILYRPQSTIS